MPKRKTPRPDETAILRSAPAPAPEPVTAAVKKKPLKSLLEFRDVLDALEPRPSDDAAQDQKRKYAQNMSALAAYLIANRLRRTDPFSSKRLGILPAEDGSGIEAVFATGKAKKPKRTDVTYSTAQAGLELLVSLKSLNFRDRHKSVAEGIEAVSYHKHIRNVVRNDHELRAEAMDQHDRHPYAVLIGILFEPLTACDDAGEKKGDKSSFAHAVTTFRFRAGRETVHEPKELFERFFIGLYETEGPTRGEMMFFDVMKAPPQKGRPTKNLITLDGVINEIKKTYGIRNRLYIVYEEDEGKPLGAVDVELSDELEVGPEEDGEDLEEA